MNGGLLLELRSSIVKLQSRKESLNEFETSLLSLLDKAVLELERRDNECGRIYYHPSAQEDKICRLPRGHQPAVSPRDGCNEPQDEDDEDESG